MPQPTVTRTSVITRTETRGPVTQTYTTTITSTASCHLPSTTYVWTTSYVYDTPTNSFCIGNACGGSDNGGGGVIIGGGSNGGGVGVVIGGSGGGSSTIRIGKRRLGHVGPDEPARPAKREDAAVAAKTVTYTQTTYTYTQTSTTTIAATTTTERVFNRATTTVYVILLTHLFLIRSDAKLTRELLPQRPGARHRMQRPGQRPPDRHGHVAAGWNLHLHQRRLPDLVHHPDGLQGVRILPTKMSRALAAP